jgi:predicted SAM-dependent methyltransferase
VSAKSSIKRLGKRLASPFTSRVYGRIDFRAAELHRDFNTLPAVIDARTAELSADIEALNRYLPTVINTIASQNAASRLTQRQITDALFRIEQLESLDGAIKAHSASIEDLWARIEFVRREILIESRYRESAPAAPEKSDGPIPPRILAGDKVRKMKGNLRLNVGAGHIPREGYLNVDARELPGIDVLADVRLLPFEAGDLSEIYSAHLLEHFPIEELRRSILPHWVSLLEDGGKLVAVVPDVETMVVEHAAGRIDFKDFIEVMYGGQEYDGDFHYSGFSKETLTALLEEAGLEDVKVIEEGRRNGACFEMEFEAVRRIASSG